MLRDIEAALGERDSWTLRELARRLAADQEMVRAGLEHLVRLGRLPAGTLVSPCRTAADLGCASCGLRCAGARSRD